MRDWHSFALIVALGAAIHNVLSQSSIPSTGLPVGSCTPDIPCANGACCNGNSGFCGYGPDFCTEVSKGGNCTSHCDAIAECGEFAAAVNRTCPLNVCCSQYGFCGTTEEFCSAGCQNNCNPTPPVGGGNDVFGGGINHRRIGYYEGWAIASSSRTCDFYQPEQIAAETLTHVNFAFALISTSFQIIEMSPGDRDLWTRTTALKKRNASLKVYLSIGGWTFNDPPTSTIFSQLVASTANINAFISSALSIMQAYGFDGLDIDWEYPASYDRGGDPADKENYVTFMKALRGAFGSNYGLSFTAPSSFWYLQHFDLPGLLKYSDFVNIMTYDLHGTWDGTDPWIGKIVLAHTNLTEIKQTLQLFQNVAVDWAQVNIGFGFYGRSFELASAQCNTPGCAFSGPAAAGPCTGNPGTLSWSEIQHIIASNNLQPVLDADAAVKYVVWNDRQWVSYDDDETFLLKRDYLDGIVGGSFVWSVDQDDTQYTALKALYPEIGVNDPSSTQTNQCKVTGCGEGCPDNWTLMTTLTTPPTGPKCESNNRASLCCPKGAVPQNCGWHDTVLQGSGINCMGQCNLGQVLLALDPAGNPDWPVCVTGNQAYCCDSGTTAPLDCYSTGCGSLLSECPSGYTGMTFVKQGSTDNGYCADENKVRPTPITCPVVCPTNNKAVCCASESSYTNCHWAGTPPSCQDSGCGVGQVTVFQDIQGDASSSCVGNARRSYCCTPPSNEQFLPVPETWVIPIGEGYGTAEQPASFTVDYDDNIGPESTTGQGAGSTGIGDDGDENDSPFGELFVTSPNAQSVSSLDVQSDWVLVGCDAKSDQPQSVLAYCALGINDDDSGCGHVFIGQAQHTIVRMPSSCGRGPYARVISFDVHENQDELPVEHQDALPENEKVYRLNFDYNFAAIPEENGPVFMRADLTDIPGYWDAIVDSPPDNTPETKRGLKYNYKRNFHNPHEYQKRWFGGFKQWLARLNTITNSNSLSRNFHWSDTYTIYHAEESCPNFQSSLDISVSGQAQMNSQFGYYLEATVVPPAIQQAYVYVKAGASASATFTMKGIAKAEWTSDAYELISFGFPGLYYPGLLTLGPSLHLYGQLSGEISLTGTLSTTVGYTFPSIDYAIGSKTDEPTLGAPLSGSDASNNGYDYNFGYNVELSGGLTAYLTPSLELGLTVLGGAVMDATAYVQAELYAGINLNGSVSETQAPKVCVQPFYGVNLHGGLKGAVVFWSGTFDHTFYEKGFNFGGACYGSLEHNGKRDGTFGNITRSARSGNAISIEHEAPRAFYSKWERKADAPTAGHEGLPSKRAELPESKPKQERAQKRAAIPYLPGSLFCPAEAGDLDQTTSSGADCMCYSDTNQAPTGQLIDVLGRRALGQEDLFERTWDDSTVSPAADSLDNSTQFSNRNILPPKVLVEYAKLRTCNLKVRIPDYSKTSIIAYYDHDNPGALDPTIGSYTQLPLNLGGNLVNSNGVPVYAREHVYEQSLSSLFIDFLQESPNLWQTAQGLKNDPNQPGIDWCTWVQNNLFAVPAYMPAGSKSVMDAALGGCYPSAVDPFGRGLSGITGNMAVLEQTINEIKNTAFYDGERKLIPSLAEQPIRKTVDFSKECPQKQVAVIRAAAAIPSFLNEWAVRREFLTANTCIRGVWLKWYNAYLAATTVDAPNRAQVNVPNLYDNWIASIVKNIKPFLTNQITTLIGAYNDEVNGKPGGAPKVDLSFYVLMDNKQVASKQKQPLNTPPSVYVVDQPVSKADLTSQVLNKMPDLVLATLLPVH